MASLSTCCLGQRTCLVLCQALSVLGCVSLRKSITIVYLSPQPLQLHPTCATVPVAIRHRDILCLRPRASLQIPSSAIKSKKVRTQSYRLRHGCIHFAQYLLIRVLRRSQERDQQGRFRQGPVDCLEGEFSLRAQHGCSPSSRARG